MKQRLTQAFSLLGIVGCLAAAPTEATVRTLALACHADLSASRAYVRIWSAAGQFRRRSVGCGQRRAFVLNPGDTAELSIWARHSVLGKKHCLWPLPDWQGDIVCGMEGMQVESEVW